MTKSFIEELELAIEHLSTYEQMGFDSARVDNNFFIQIAQRLIAIDDLTSNDEQPNCPVIATGYKLAMKEIRRILEGE